MYSRLNIFIFLLFIFIVFDGNCYNNNRKQNAALVKKHLKRLKKQEGGIKLVGGRGEHEGNVEILHNGRWGAVCDDEWDDAEAMVVCRQLGFSSEGNHKPTHSATFGHARRHYWMDNLYCDGSERELINCRFDGWGQSDCQPNEAAGVICHDIEAEESEDEPVTEKPAETILSKLPDKIEVRLKGGRIYTEGRVEVRGPNDVRWHTICADGWSLLEAMVICRSLRLGYASSATQTNFFGGNITKESYHGIKCLGNERSLSDCLFDEANHGFCPGNEVAGVICVDEMADLVIDHMELTRTAFLQDQQLYFLTCAMEENCLASAAYKIQKESPNWHLETRRLLRFTARILNAGTDDFKPIIPKHLWEWHMCHMHYHSMEVFATFNIYDQAGRKVAEGHKASFCLEDNLCLPGVKPKFSCANYGDQGISPNCSDIYRYNIDCQWIDISDLIPGVYTLRVAVNPEFKIPEISFDNNAAICTFYYSQMFGHVTNCTLTRP